MILLFALSRGVSSSQLILCLQGGFRWGSGLSSSLQKRYGMIEFDAHVQIVHGGVQHACQFGSGVIHQSAIAVGLYAWPWHWWIRHYCGNKNTLPEKSNLIRLNCSHACLKVHKALGWNHRNAIGSLVIFYSSTRCFHNHKATRRTTRTYNMHAD